MAIATVMRTDIQIRGRPLGDHVPPTEIWSEPLFEGPIDDAIAFVRAQPVGEHRWLTVETETSAFRVEDFDRLQAGTLFDQDYDMAYGELTVYCTSAALKLMKGTLDGPLSCGFLINEHLDLVKAIVHQKRIDGLVELVDGRPVVLVDAADLPGGDGLLS